MSSMMDAFDSANALSCAIVQQNGIDGFRSSRNGAMTSVMLNVYDTWFTRLNHDLVSFRLVGVGKSSVARVNFPHGFTVVLVMVKPANSVSSAAKQNFRGLRVISFLPHMSNHSTACWYASSIVSDQIWVSSMHFVCFLMRATIASYLDVYPSPEAMYP